MTMAFDLVSVSGSESGQEQDCLKIHYLFKGAKSAN